MVTSRRGWQHARFAPLAALAALAAAVAFRSPRHTDKPDAQPPAAVIGGAPRAAAAGSIASSGGSDLAAGEGAARMFHGDSAHVHRARARGPVAATLAWSRSVGGPVAAQVVASPDEQTLYVASLAGELLALARNGDVRWRVALGDRAYGTPLVGGDGTVFVGSDAKRLFAISPAGAVKWRLEVDGECDTSPTFDAAGRVVFAAGRSVYAVDVSGRVAWRYRAGGKVFSSPAILPSGAAVFGAQDGRVCAIDSAGKPVFCTELGADVDASPVVASDAIYIGTDRGDVVRLDPAGAVAWRTAVGGFVRGGLSLARSGDVLAGVYGPAPRVVRVSPAGLVVGSFSVSGTGAPEFGVHGAPLEDAAHTLYFGAQDDTLYAVGAGGALLFRFATGGDIDAPATLLSDGSLVFASEDGSVYNLAIR